jgi:CBS-domain-containing membrane protein
MLVDEVMSRDAVTCTIDDTLQDVARLLWKNDRRALPVVDGDARVIGVVTERDVCVEACRQGLPLAEIPVTDAMHALPSAVAPDEDVVDATRLMGQEQTMELPVTDATGHVVGVIALRDIMRAMARPDRLADGALDVVMSWASSAAPGR